MNLRRFARPLTLPGIFFLLLPAVPQSAFAPPPITFGANIHVGAPDSELRQSDPSVAVNPIDPDNMVVLYREVNPAGSPLVVCRFATTFDGGSTWQIGPPVPLQKKDSLCDQPSAVADSQGNFYLAYKDLYSLGPNSEVVDLLVAKSTDGGATFPSYSAAVKHGSNSIKIYNQIYPVKSYLAVDNGAGSPYQGTLYLGFTSQNAQPDPRVLVVSSRDGGSRWSDPVVVAEPTGTDVDELYQDNALPVVAPDGTAYLFFSEWKSEEYSAEGPMSIRLARSTDGGASWQPQADVATGLISAGKFRIKNAEVGWPGATGTFGVFGTSYPTAAITPNGSIYVAWTDFPNGYCVFPNKCSNADVRLSVSNNGGTTWSAPVPVSDEVGSSDQFNPWIAAHADGTVSLSWADRRLDPNNVNYDIFYTQTSDGVHFLNNVQVSTATSLVGTWRYAGEYSGLAATPGGVLSVWTDSRSGGSNLDIFFARGTLKP